MQPRTLPTDERTREALKQGGHPPLSLLPGRFLVPVKHEVEDVMPDGFGGAISAELRQRCGDMERQTAGDFTHWRLDDIMRTMHSVLAPLRRKIIEHLPAACEACHIAEFDLTNVTMWAELHHHGCEGVWHDLAGDPRDDTRRIVFDYFLHSTPVMFVDGNVEFHDGSTVAPLHNSLLWTHPLQKRRTQNVNCYSADALHGRWAIRGILHGPAPDGYAELADRLRS